MSDKKTPIQLLEEAHLVEFYGGDEDRNRYKLFFKNLIEIDKEFNDTLVEIVSIDKEKIKNNTILHHENRIESKFKSLIPVVSFFYYNQKILELLKNKFNKEAETEEKAQQQRNVN
jgi:hypothetical protein